MLFVNFTHVSLFLLVSLSLSPAYMHICCTISICLHLTLFALGFVLPDIKIHTLVNLFELDTYIFDTLLFSTIFVSHFRYRSSKAITAVFICIFTLLNLKVSSMMCNVVLLLLLFLVFLPNLKFIYPIVPAYELLLDFKIYIHMHMFHQKLQQIYQNIFISFKTTQS